MDGNQMKARSGGADEQRLKKPGITQTCILFSITIILFIFIGYRVQRVEFYSGILITEFGLIMLPAFVLLLIFRFDLKFVLRLNKTKLVNYFVTFGIMLFAIPLAGMFNLLNLLLVNSIFGKVIIQQVPVAKNGTELLLNIIVIAGSAGICEEFLFRGVIQRGLERFGAAKAILLAAFLFSLTHVDFQKIFGTFLLGALIGFIVYRTNSLYCGVFAHFTNNALAVLISYGAAKLTSMFQETAMNITEETDLNSLFSTFGELPPQQLVIVFFIYGFMFLFFAILFILLLYALIRLNPVRGLPEAVNVDVDSNTSTRLVGYNGANLTDRSSAGLAGRSELPEIPGRSGRLTRSELPERTGRQMIGLLWLLPGILLIFGIYYFQVFRFTGAENTFIDIAKRLLGV